MIKELPLNDAIKLHNSIPNSYLSLSGNIGTIYTESDIPQNMYSQKLISVQQFRDRFTDIEIGKFIDMISTDAIVAKLNFKLSTTDGIIDLDSIEVIKGINYLASIGIVKVERINDILL